jgi:gluconokinase
MVNASPGQPPVLVLMGVSGCGKSTVAGLLAGRLGWDFEEGDDLHPAANVDKMASGHQLDDDDRWPWLAKVAEWIGEHTDAGRPGIITCSALKKSYRDVLRGERVVFVYLAGTREQIARRLAARHGHYMPASLLDSQFDALEPPTPEEKSITVDIAASASVESDEIMSRLGLIPKASTQAGKQPMNVSLAAAAATVEPWAAHDTRLTVVTVIGIAIIVLLIVVLKMNPFLALILGSAGGAGPSADDRHQLRGRGRQHPEGGRAADRPGGDARQAAGRLRWR